MADYYAASLENCQKEVPQYRFRAVSAPKLGVIVRRLWVLNCASAVHDSVQLFSPGIPALIILE